MATAAGQRPRAVAVVRGRVRLAGDRDLDGRRGIVHAAAERGRRAEVDSELTVTIGATVSFTKVTEASGPQ